MSVYQPCFFDESERLAALLKLRDPLEQLTRYIDFESFTRFLELKLGSKIPDFSTVWRFREALSEAGAVKGLYERFTRHLEENGVIRKSGVIVDASFVEVPRQRNSREENKKIKEGTVPQNWKSDPDKLSHKDVDARWTKKNHETFFGYKDRVRTDADTVLITDYVVTNAALAQVHLRSLLPELGGQSPIDRSVV